MVNILLGPRWGPRVVASYSAVRLMKLEWRKPQPKLWPCPKQLPSTVSRLPNATQRTSVPGKSLQRTAASDNYDYDHGDVLRRTLSNEHGIRRTKHGLRRRRRRRRALLAVSMAVVRSLPSVIYFTQHNRRLRETQRASERALYRERQRAGVFSLLAHSGLQRWRIV